jgi:hypothetical protein
VALAVLSASPSAHAGSSPLIIIDRWSGVDYAKNSCHRGGDYDALCNRQERIESYNKFELQLKTQFAALPECAGITVSVFGYPQNPKELSPDTLQPYWSFSINYYGDEPAQLWQMLPPERQQAANDGGDGNAVADSYTGLHDHQRQGRRCR